MRLKLALKEAMMSIFIDTHCHLDDSRYEADLEEVVKRAQNFGVKGCIIPAASPDTLARAREIATQYPHIYFACGLHPCEISHSNASASNHATLQECFSLLDEPKCIAIGECGLDYYHFLDSLPKQEQKRNQAEVFIAHIEQAIARDLPLIVHIRESSNDAYEILSQYPKARGVLHCYNADEILLKLSDRFYYGIGGVATFKNARRLVEVLPKIPLERIVLETDAPYLTPHPHRGQRNSPEYIPLIAQRVAQILSTTQDQLATISTNNARALFAINTD